MVGERSDKVIVAVKAEKVISNTALAWALTHVVQPGDCVTLLAIISPLKTGNRFWRFPRFTGDCGSRHREDLPDRICQISESCSQMVLQFHNQIQVTVRIKVVLSTPGGTVAAEATFNGANWVVLDKKLKQEKKHCMEELGCNIVVMNGSQPKVLKLNLGCSDELQTQFFSAASSPGTRLRRLEEHRMNTTPVSSPEEPSSSCTRTTGEGSSSSYDTVTSLFLVYEQNPLFEGQQARNHRPHDLEDPYEELDSIGERLITLCKPRTSTLASTQSVFWIPQNHSGDRKHSKPQTYKKSHKVRSPTFQTLFDEYAQFDQDTRSDRAERRENHNKGYITNSNIRDAVSLGTTSSIPPPLCSLCQHKTPVFGKPPKQFSYQELEEATDAFSDVNFLAEGGFGVVHRGVLRDGQVVAVKQLKFGGSQADADFCREVRVLSCAQHRNVVLLIGYCIEGKSRLLVYEYICNSSLDFHLHGVAGNRTPLDYESRLKIATGTARGLRYLHEDCRVGCIVHRDLRPNNILLTHDFEPLVADFGLARWHSEWETSTEDRCIGTSGYLAPEYIDSGQITHKVDVYAFGVVLLELMTGRRIGELHYVRGHHFLEEWLHRLATLEPNHISPISYHLLDSNMASESPDFPYQLQAMARAASLCLRRDPEFRPSMSKLIRVLEGGDPVVPIGLDLNTVGSRSGHLPGLSSQRQPKPSMSKLIRVLEGGDPVVPIGLDLNTVGSRSGHLPGLSSQRQPKPRGNHSRKLSH